jgi:hypothetical protein
MKSDADMASLAENGIQVFPSANEIPANLLRFHLRFDDAPDVFDISTAIRLVDAYDVVVDHVFLDLNEGLWSADGLTLTLMLHPGRIKSGLIANHTLGNALHEQDQYELQIRSEHLCNLYYVDTGSPANAKNEWISIKRFTAIAAVDQAIDVNSLSFKTPKAHSLNSISITFPWNIDVLSAENCVGLSTALDLPVDVQIELGEAEKTIRFIPRHPWAKGPVKVHFSSEFEDVSGNRLSNAFAKDMHFFAYDTPTVVKLLIDR